jgi:putative uncharacterized protein (fragment)
MKYEKIKLSDLVDTVSDTRKINKDKVVLINTSDIFDGDVLNHSYTDNSNLRGQFKKRFEKNDILYSEIRPANKRFAYVDFDSEDYIASTKLMVLRKRSNSITNRFLYYCLTNDFFTEKMQHLAEARSGTFPQITFDVLKNESINVPSIENQNKITMILDNINNKIKSNNEINNNLQELINNIFISKFVNYYGYTGEYETTEIGDIPSNWKVDNLGNVISFSNGYGWNSKDMLENNQPGTYKVFKMGNIKIGGGINKEKTRSWILKEKCSGLEQFLSKKGDILMCMTDMKSSENPLLGHTALIDCDDEFVINQRVGIIRCDKDIRWPYIYTMTNLPFFINNIRSKAHSGVQVNLTTSGIRDTKVLIPDKDSLEEFYKNVTPMYEEMFILNNEIEKLEELRDTLLPKLMNGEIDLDNIEI